MSPVQPGSVVRITEEGKTGKVERLIGGGDVIALMPDGSRRALGANQYSVVEPPEGLPGVPVDPCDAPDSSGKSFDEDMNEIPEPEGSPEGSPEG